MEARKPLLFLHWQQNKPKRWSPTFTHHKQTHKNLKLYSLWKNLRTLRIPERHTDFLGWQICLWGEFFHSLLSLVQKDQIENRVENWVRYDPAPPSALLNCFVIGGICILGDWKTEGEMFVSFQASIPCIVLSILPLVFDRHFNRLFLRTTSQGRLKLSKMICPPVKTEL